MPLDRPNDDDAAPTHRDSVSAQQTAVTGRERQLAHLKPWKPGQSGNPKGRVKGSRNALGEAFLAAMHDDFEKHGVAVIQQVRKEKPDQYLKVIASILPKELNVNTNALGEMSDEELGATLLALRALAAALENGSSGQWPN